jgi:glutathione S-transferase
MEWVAFRAFWMMEELGRAYELRLLLFPPLALAPRFLEVNPLGIVPAMLMANPVGQDQSQPGAFDEARA